MVSDIKKYKGYGDEWDVLILVIMEYGLGHEKELMNLIPEGVLILVIMEYGLGRFLEFLWSGGMGLNPCYNGIWSRTV